MVRESAGGDLVAVTLMVRVSETTYITLSTYDDSFLTDNDDHWCGCSINYKAHGEDAVTPVGDVSSIHVPEYAVIVI